METKVLAFIFNNRHFPGLNNRDGSEHDVRYIEETLNAAGIPFISEQDCTTEEMLKILDYLKKENFSEVKSFFFFMMSHGNENDIIYTKDGVLNVKDDIIAPIQSNKSLRNAKKLYVFNACRGSIDPYFADDDDMNIVHEKPPTVIKNLDENTAVLYSATELMTTYIGLDSGSPFMQNFIRQLPLLIILQNDIQNFHKDLEQNLKNVCFFNGHEKCSELVVQDQKKSYKVVQISCAPEMLQLIENISNNFENLRKK